MNAAAFTDIQQLQASFDSFVKLIEDISWIQSSNIENIKRAFKLSCYIERASLYFEFTNILSEFMGIMIKNWKQNNRFKIYDASFFKLASDKLLEVFFKCDNIPERNLEIAVKIYTAIYPKERLQKVISDLITESSTQKAVADFCMANLNENATKELEYALRLELWSEFIQTCRESVVKQEIQNLLTLYKIESSLHILIGMLSLTVNSSNQKSAQSLLLKCVVEKMSDRSILCKPFWLTLFKKVDITLVSKSCANHKEFLEALFHFIIYAGSMLKKDSFMWQADPTICLCPEIGYIDLLNHIKSIMELNPELGCFVFDRLKQAKEDTNCLIWNEIRNELFY